MLPKGGKPVEFFIHRIIPSPLCLLTNGFMSGNNVFAKINLSDVITLPPTLLSLSVRRSRQFGIAETGVWPTVANNSHIVSLGEGLALQ